MTRSRGELLRDDTNAKVAGVCAGIANYFGWEVWLVRIITVSGLFLGIGGFVFMLYIAAWLVLETKSKAELKTAGAAYTTAKTKDKYVEIKTRVWQRGEAPKQALEHLSNQFNDIELRLRDMERHVTSTKFQLNKEFNNL